MLPPKYELRLSASDNLRENHTTVVIHVKDVNDNPPVFERPTYRTQITEEDDRTLPKSVVQVEFLYGRFDRIVFFKFRHVFIFLCSFILRFDQILLLLHAGRQCFEKFHSVNLGSIL